MNKQEQIDSIRDEIYEKEKLIQKLENELLYDISGPIDKILNGTTWDLNCCYCHKTGKLKFFSLKFDEDSTGYDIAQDVSEIMGGNFNLNEKYRLLEHDWDVQIFDIGGNCTVDELRNLVKRFSLKITINNEMKRHMLEKAELAKSKQRIKDMHKLIRDIYK